MRYIRDTSGRFPERPYYEPGELDELCEGIVETFLRRKYGTVRYPIPTDGLELLIEQQEVVLDCYSDLDYLGADTHGATVFEPNKPTRVYVSKQLSENAVRENRFRTTLAHELGHVLLHGPLFRAAKTGDLFDLSASSRATCTRRSVELAAQTDWLEWQAGFVAGALLMPITRLRQLAATTLSEVGAVSIDSTAAQSLIRRVMRTFQVSRAAAEVRLQQAGLVTPREVSRLL